MHIRYIPRFPVSSRDNGRIEEANRSSMAVLILDAFWNPGYLAD
jgi:hypothetical protein